MESNKMNKYQARCKLIAGKKITHAHFTPSEFIHVVRGKTINGEGYDMAHALYNPFSHVSPVDGWELFEPENEEE